ncbi:10549_t:CDS:2, partial [Gigaspora rosea]
DQSSRIDQIWTSKELGLGIVDAKIEEMSKWTDSDHNAAIVKIYLGHLIEKKNFSTIKQRGQKRTIYLYNKASAEDWENYATVLLSSLKDNQAIKRINIVQSGTVVGKKELDQKKSRIKTDLEKSILDLGKVIRNICDNKTSQSNFSIIVSANNTILNINRILDIEIDMLQAQNLDKGEQDLRGWKKILEKKCLLENT